MSATAEILPPVTDKRTEEYIQSPSRNDCCVECERPFATGETRYVIWGYHILEEVMGLSIYVRRVMSVCGKCFLTVPEKIATRFPRKDRTCSGCEEPINTPAEGPFKWRVCCDRCRQREYRQRRAAYRGWHRACATCEAPMKGKRKDARYCSARCKQWAHRRRHA